MNRFIDHFRQRVPLSAGAEAFIRQHSRLLVYDRLAHFTIPGIRTPYWCVVLQGLAYGYTLDGRGERRIHWFATEMQGFAGVRHLYTPRQAGHYIQFPEVSTVLRIPALRMREGKETFSEINELMHIMKQQYIDRQDRLVQVLQQALAYNRFASFMSLFPELAARTSPEHQMDFINVSRPTYYRVQQQWLRTRKS